MKRIILERLRLSLAPALVLLASAIPSAVFAQAGPNSAGGGQPRFPGFGNPFMRPAADEPTDGKDHPLFHVNTPISSDVFNVDHAEVKVSARVDRQAGFRLGGTLLSYQNYATDPEKPADAAPVLFGGKFAEDVNVNDKKWTNLLQPYKNPSAIPRLSTPVDPSFDTNITFMPRGCEITLTEHGKSLEVIATNPNAEPARFRFNLVNGDTSAARKKADTTASRKAEAKDVPLPGGKKISPEASAATGSTVEASAAATSTDGTAHPDRPMIAPEANAAFKPEGKIVLKGTVDRSCGFQIRGNTLYYLNSVSAASSGYGGSPNSRLTFDGKYASGVTVNGEAWSNLNRPFSLNTTLKEHSAKNITFKGASCEFSYRKYGDALAIFITNYDKNAFQDKPSQFELVFYFADPAE